MTHAQKRLRQRYGIKPTRNLMKKAKHQIRYKSPKAKFIRPGKGGSEIYLVPVAGRKVLAVFSWKWNEIVTFLPKEAI